MNKILLLFFLMTILFSCQKKGICVCKEGIDSTLMRNKKIFYVTDDTVKVTPNYLKSWIMERLNINQDTIFVFHMKVDSSKRLEARVLYKMILSDTLISLDTFLFPNEIKFIKSRFFISDNFGNILIAPDKNKLLLTYYIYNKEGDLNGTKLLIYDTRNWNKQIEAFYPSNLLTNKDAWSPDSNKILFQDLKKSAIIIFNNKTKNFSEIITNQKDIRYTKWGERNDKFYYNYNKKFLIEYDLTKHKTTLLYRAPRKFLKEWVINDFYVGNNDTIYLRLVGIIIDNLIYDFKTCTLTNCPVPHSPTS